MPAARHRTETSPDDPARWPCNVSPLTRCVGDVQRFATEHWGRRPMVHRSGAGFDDLLSTDMIEEMLDLAPRRPTFRLVRDGTVLPIDSYTRTVRLGGAWTGDVADVDAIASHIGQGATLILQSLDRSHPPLRAFTAAMHAEISHPVQANAYLSPTDSAGLAPHSDTHDVLVLQVEGAKRWDVADLGTVELEPGDVVYIPRGHRHSAATASRHSLHITIGITAVTWQDVARRALSSVTEPAAPLDLGFARTPLAEHVAVMTDALTNAVNALASCDPRALAESERRRVDGTLRRRPSLHSHLEAASLSDETRIARRRGSTWAVVGDRVLIESEGRQVSMPMNVLAAVDAVFARPDLTIADFEGLDGPSRLVLARRLLREGLVEIRRV